MKLKTKMILLFAIIVVVPIIFFGAGFIGLGIQEEVNVLQEMQTDGAMIGAMVSKRFMTNMLIVIIVDMVLLGVFITMWINQDIYKPLKELSMAMKDVGDGNFNHLLDTNREDEIGQLFGNYERMRLALKESQEAEDENEKKSKELISNITHDLKTPITSIKGYVEGIMDGVADTPEKMDKYIKTIYNKANDMDKLINELTTYSGIDQNKIPYHFIALNISNYFADCVEEVGMDMDSKGITLNYTNLVSPDTLIVADPEQMKKVINNIISNSVKYMGHENGNIDIRILDEGESIKIEIEDDGKGIAARDIGHIFERFYRADASRNSMQGGSGIGLSIVKKIIEDHGGYIWATSKEGEGTCMHFVIRKYIQTPNDTDTIDL